MFASFRGVSPLLVAAHAGFAPSGANPPFDVAASRLQPVWRRCARHPRSRDPAQKQRGHWPKGAKGGPASVPEGVFDRNRRIWLETAQPMRRKAIQGLLSRFRWSRTTSIFVGISADLNRALSALFSTLDSDPTVQMAPNGLWDLPPPTRAPQVSPWKRNWGLGLVVGGLDKLLGAWIRILNPGQESWSLD